MNKKQPKWFYIILILIIPLLAVLFYFKTDPFKVLYTYNDFYANGIKEIPLDRNYVSTEFFIKNYPVIKYDSYIFGDNNSHAVMCTDWQMYVGSNCFHFDANGENIRGISDKLTFLKEIGAPVKNCLIILDSAILSGTENVYDRHYIEHPIISNESELCFKFTFFYSFFETKFFMPYIFYKMKIKPPGFLSYPEITDKNEYAYDRIYNDITFLAGEKILHQNMREYFKNPAFSNRDTVNIPVISKVINSKQVNFLKTIQQILKEKKTNFKIIILPDYFLKKMNPEDLKTLKEIFGENNIYDFSGKNPEAFNLWNFYTDYHPGQNMGRRILPLIYK